MVFASTHNQTILINEIGLCPIQLVQYDSATLHLSAQDISVHRFLKNQKRIYQELKPQKREILQNQFVALTSDSLLTFDAFQQQTSCFNLLSKSCQVTSYDLVSSYTESSPFKYALVFSKRIKRTSSLRRNSFNHFDVANSYFHHTVKSIPHRVPWLKYPTSNVESVVILFDHKRQRKVWKQCLKRFFGLRVLNLNKAIYRNSGEQYQPYEYIYQEPRQSQQYDFKDFSHAYRQYTQEKSRRSYRYDEKDEEDYEADQEYQYTHKVQPLNIVKNSYLSPSSSFNSSFTTAPSLSTSPTSYYSSPPMSPKSSLKLCPEISDLCFKQPPATFKPTIKYDDDDLIENDLFNQELFQLTTKFNKHNNIIDDFNDLLTTTPSTPYPTPIINYNNFIPPPNSPPKFKLPKIPE